MNSRFNLLPIVTILCAVLHLAAASLASELIQTAKLTPPDTTGFDRFGVHVAVSGDTLVAAAPEYRRDGKFGAAYIFTKNGDAWEFDTQLLSPHARPFATSIAIDGDTIVIGGMEDRAAFGGVDAGLAFVYTRTSVGWTLAQELSAPDLHSPNRAASAVAIEDDTIVIGVDMDNSGGPTAGAAYIFRKSAGTWAWLQKLYAPNLEEGARFGNAVDLNGDYLAIAALLETGARGAVHLFTRENTIWTHKTRFMAPDAFSGAVFGRSIALSDELLVVGRTDDHEAAPSAGAAYVFRLVPELGEFVQKLLADDRSAFAGFGTSVAILGDDVLVGSSSTPYAGMPTVGTVYVFSPAGNGFAQTQQVAANDPTSFSGFGWALAADTDTVVVGAPFQESNGIAYVFEPNNADEEPPVIVSAQATPSVLSPPNNKLVPVTLAVTATDNSGAATCRIISVTVDDPASIRKQPAYEITGDLTANLRAERNARGRPRIYSLLIECRDESGNSTQTTVHVKVP